MLKLLKPVHEYAKSPFMKSANPDEAFLLIPKSAIMGRDANGNLILNKSADVSEDIRKEDMDASGYGMDGADELSGAETGAPMSAEEAKEHAGNLQKCRGAIMKAAGLGEEDMVDGNSDEPQQTAGEDPEAFKARVAAFRKAKGGTSVVLSELLAEVKSMKEGLPALVEATIQKSIAPGSEAPVPRPGTVVLQKAAPGTAPTAGSREEIQKAVDALKEERKGLIAKRDAKLDWTPQESVRAQQIGDELMRLETALMVPIPA